MGHSSADRIPAFGFDLLARSRIAVVFGRHLSQQPIAQSQWGIAESSELATFQESKVNRRARHDNLGASRTDSGKFPASFERQSRQQLCDPSHLCLGHCGSARAFGLVDAMADRSQRFRSPGRSNDNLRASAFNPVSGPLDLARDESPHLTHFGFAGWVVTQKFVGQTNGAEWQADGIADMPLTGNGQLTTSSAQVRHQYGGGIHSQS